MLHFRVFSAEIVLQNYSRSFQVQMEPQLTFSYTKIQQTPHGLSACKSQGCSHLNSSSATVLPSTKNTKAYHVHSYLYCMLSTGTINFFPTNGRQFTLCGFWLNSLTPRTTSSTWFLKPMLTYVLIKCIDISELKKKIGISILLLKVLGLHWYLRSKKNWVSC